MVNKPTRIDSVLSRSTALADLARTAEKRAASGIRIVDRLPPDIKSHVVSAGVHEDRLRVTLDSPVWAARLRFHAPELGELLAELGVERLEVRVRQPNT